MNQARRHLQRSARSLWLCLALGLCCASAQADTPVASYLFPAGGQRGKTVAVKVGGLNLLSQSGFVLVGPGLTASKTLKPTQTFWLEGPRLQLPDSQQAEDYPKDNAGSVQIADEAPLGLRPWYVHTSQGISAGGRFQVGDLPELVEEETDGEPVPTAVTLPSTVNGRIFPRQDIDLWQCTLSAGQSCSCLVYANRLGSPLDAKLEILDPNGRKIAENDDTFGSDPFVRFVAPTSGKYQVRIYDANYRGGQAFVYRLTLSVGPFVERVYPLGGQSGKATTVQVLGQALPGSLSVSAPVQEPGQWLTQLSGSTAKSNPFAFDVDQLPEYLEAEPNASAEQAKTVALPAILNGRIDQAGDEDTWVLTAEKGTQLEIEYRHGRLYSPLDAVLSLTSATGAKLSFTQASNGPTSADLVARFTMPAEGRCLLTVREQFRTRGGPSFAYRLKVHELKSGLKLTASADTLTVPRAGQATLKVTAERRGSLTEAIELEVTGLPTDVELVGKPTIAAKQNQATLTFKAGAETKIAVSKLQIVGKVTAQGQPITQPVVYIEPTTGLAFTDLLLATAVPTPFKVVGDYEMRWAPRGTVLTRKYKLERNGFIGPVKVMLSDKQGRHLQGVSGPTLTLADDATEFAYPLFLPPWMETGRTSRACVMAVGKVRDADGTEHEVSYTSLNTTEQIIAVVETGKLDIELDREAYVATPGEQLIVACQVLRGKDVVGPAKLELVLPKHMQDILVEPIELPNDQARGKLVLKLPKVPRGAWNAPITIRATVLDANKQPIVGEARFELLPKE